MDSRDIDIMCRENDSDNHEKQPTCRIVREYEKKLSDLRKRSCILCQKSGLRLANIAELEQEDRRQKQERMEKQAEMEALTTKLKEHEEILKLRERELEQVNEMNFRLIEMSREFEQEKDYWRSMFYDMQNSTSWRVTKGLRVISRLVRRKG